MEEYENQMEVDKLTETVGLIKTAIKDLPKNHDDVSEEQADQLVVFFNKLLHEVFPGLD